MRFKILPALFLATISASAFAAIAVDGTGQPSISLQTLKEVTKQLSSDEFEGRAPTTAGEQKTLDLIVKRFAQAGLQPGNKGNWFQDVPLVAITSTPTALSVTGGKEPLTFQYRIDMSASSPHARPQVDLQDSQIVFAGFGFNAPERGWNDYAGADVKGKTVILLSNEPDADAPGLEGPFDGRARTYYSFLKYEEAARQGAAAVFIIQSPTFGWKGGPSVPPLPKYSLDAANDHLDKVKVAGQLSYKAAQALFASAGMDLAALTVAAKRAGFKAVPLKTKASISVSNQIKRQASKNVVGILPGTTRPDEYVLYSAHWDHLGICETNPKGDNICNGATDNASGMAGLIALAETHVAAGPADRSILFLSVTAEESGLLGSQYYAENPIYPLTKTAGNINMDELNLHGATRDIIIYGAGKNELENMLTPILATKKQVIVPDPAPEEGFYYRSDHISFAKYGLPAISFEGGNDLLKGGNAVGAAKEKEYRTKRYHTPKDEYNPAWDWSGALQELGLYYLLGRQLAESDAWPNWHPKDEFRAIRDKSRAGQ